MASSEDDDVDISDEDKVFLQSEPVAHKQVRQPGLGPKFWLSAGINTIATAAIVRS